LDNHYSNLLNVPMQLNKKRMPE